MRIKMVEGSSFFIFKYLNTFGSLSEHGQSFGISYMDLVKKHFKKSCFSMLDGVAEGDIVGVRGGGHAWIGAKEDMASGAVAQEGSGDGQRCIGFEATVVARGREMRPEGGDKGSWRETVLS